MVTAHRTVLYAKRREATLTLPATKKLKIDARRRYFHFSSSESDFIVTFRKKSSEKRFFVTFFEKVIIFSFFHR